MFKHNIFNTRQRINFMMKKIGYLLLSILVFSVAAAYSIADYFTIGTSANKYGLPDSLGFLVPLSYQVGPGGEFWIKGWICHEDSSPYSSVNVNLYAKVEGDTNLLVHSDSRYWELEVDKNKVGDITPEYIEENYKMSAYMFGTNWDTTTINRNLQRGQCAVFMLKLKVASNLNQDGKVRAYFKMEAPDFDIVKEKYSDYVSLSRKPPEISEWNVDIVVVAAGLASLLAGLVYFVRSRL